MLFLFCLMDMVHSYPRSYRMSWPITLKPSEITVIAATMRADGKRYNESAKWTPTLNPKTLTSIRPLSEEDSPKISKITTVKITSSFRYSYTNRTMTIEPSFNQSGLIVIDENKNVVTAPPAAFSSIFNNSMVNVTQRPETDVERLNRYWTYVENHFFNFTLICIDNTLPNNSLPDLLPYHFEIDERLHRLIQPLEFCLLDTMCPLKEEIDVKPNFTLAAIRDEIIPPVENFFSMIDSISFNVSTEETNMDEGNTTGCPDGHTRFFNQTECVETDKYMIPITELWHEMSRPARNILGILTTLDLFMANVSINCTIFNFTDRPIILPPPTPDENTTTTLSPPTTTTEKPFLNCTGHNVSAECNATGPVPTCYPLTNENDTFDGLLQKFEFGFSVPYLEMNCSTYDIYDYPNLTLSEAWDVVNEPSRTLFQLISILLVNLTSVKVDCSKHHDKYIDSNRTLPKVLLTLLETNNKTLDVLSSIFFRIPNFTITCYDYVFPVNITVPIIIPIPWYEDPRTFLIGGGGIFFILNILIMVQVCKYCQKYKGVFIPGRAKIEIEKAMTRKEKAKEKKKKAFAAECRRKGFKDPNRPKRKRRKPKKKKKKKLTPEEQKEIDDAAREEWVLRHIDSAPYIVDTPVANAPVADTPV